MRSLDTLLRNCWRGRGAAAPQEWRIHPERAIPVYSRRPGDAPQHQASDRGGRGSIDLGAGSRTDPEYAQRHRAQVGQFDFGSQRTIWLGQIVADWMDYDGILKMIRSQIRHPNVVGDTNTVCGIVIEKYVHTIYC